MSDTPAAGNQDTKMSCGKPCATCPKTDCKSRTLVPEPPPPPPGTPTPLVIVSSVKLLDES